MQPVGHCDGHQLVPGRVELDLVDPVSVSVMAAQDRGVLIRQPPPLASGVRTGQRAEGNESRIVAIPAEGRKRLSQGWIVGKDVVAQGRGLVGHLVRTHATTVNPEACIETGTRGTLTPVRPTDEQLTHLLGSWLPRQRWFAGKSAGFDCWIAQRLDLPAEGAEHVVVTVRIAGEEQRYHVPILTRPTAEDGLIGRVGDVWIHDGLAHHRVVDALVHWPQRARWLVPPIHAVDSEPFRVEQSNSSVRYDNALVKFYRRLGPGASAEVEALLGLAEVGCGDVAPLWGWVHGEANLALITGFVDNAEDGGRLAAGYAGDAADFTQLAFGLGQTVRRVHGGLQAAFSTGLQDKEWVTSRIRSRLQRAVSVAPVLRDCEPNLVRQLDALPSSITVQRVHGDLHLGQTLRQPGGWLVIDFEGEPGGAVGAVDHRLRDVAGMIRSFDYVARLAAPAAEADTWRDACVRAFLSGYGDVNPGILRAYMIDKAAYEVLYESGNRPHLVELPTAALVEMAASQER